MRNIKKIIADLEKSKIKIAAERDKLRELLDEVDTLSYNVEQGVEALQSSIDTLSELV